MNGTGRSRRIPAHPILATAPIGCWVASFVFDIASLRAAEPGFLTRGSYWLIGIGLLGAIVAGMAGSIDALPIPPGTPAFRAVVVHLMLSMTAVLLYAVNYVIRVAQPVHAPVAWSLVALSAVGMLIITGAAVAGAALVHRHALEDGI